jgi:2-polyprenyl-6-methoxyphenol hydroxylase-like FAD-dependent oxidoreductase
MRSAPRNDALADGTPAGPLYAYFNNSSVVATPYAQGAVLIGDAAGWNDPIIGLGLSITHRDVRLVSEILKATPAGTAPDFRTYAEERVERMRRLQMVADTQARLDMEFGDGPRERRRRYHEASAADPTIGMYGFAVMAGPESVPAEFFGAAHVARVLGA